MEKILMVMGLAAAVLTSRAQTNQTNSAGMTLLPENVPWTMAWDKPDPEAEVVIFRLYSTQTFTNQVVQDPIVGAVTNRVWQWPANALVELKTYQTGSNYLSVIVPGLPKGTNAVALTAVDALNDESEKSAPLILRVLGKPSAPQGIRKL